VRKKVVLLILVALMTVTLTSCSSTTRPTSGRGYLELFKAASSKVTT
jgi:predicted small secreted protein